jgi:hypothetical protein
VLSAPGFIGRAMPARLAATPGKASATDETSGQRRQAGGKRPRCTGLPSSRTRGPFLRRLARTALCNPRLRTPARSRRNEAVLRLGQCKRARGRRPMANLHDLDVHVCCARRNADSRFPANMPKPRRFEKISAIVDGWQRIRIAVPTSMRFQPGRSTCGPKRLQGTLPSEPGLSQSLEVSSQLPTSALSPDEADVGSKRSCVRSSAFPITTKHASSTSSTE